MDRIFWKCFLQVLGHGIRAICAALRPDDSERDRSVGRTADHLNNMQRCIDIALEEG